MLLSLKYCMPRVPLFFIAFFLLACDSSNSNDLNRYLEQLKDQTKEVQKTVKPYTNTITGPLNSASDLAKSEYSKLIKVEYKVFDLPRNEDSKNVEATLVKIGEERWDCFFIEQNVDSNRVYCKRYPLSVLKMLPHVF